MKVYKPPHTASEVSIGDYTIFLAGSIDMGSAENWQERMENDLSDFENLIVFNPRRDVWNAALPQDPTPGTEFHEQVTWELDHIESANLVVVYFSDGSASPITLLELGMLARMDKEVIIYCTPKFHRYGNVKIVADRHDIRVCQSYDELLTYTRWFVNNT